MPSVVSYSIPIILIASRRFSRLNTQEGKFLERLICRFFAFKGLYLAFLVLTYLVNDIIVDSELSTMFGIILIRGANGV